jgi:hypothetical protein
VLERIHLRFDAPVHASYPAGRGAHHGMGWNRYSGQSQSAAHGSDTSTWRSSDEPDDLLPLDARRAQKIRTPASTGA